MSNHWKLFCNDCNEDAGPRINHGEDELAGILRHRDELAAVGHIEGVIVEIGSGDWALPAWFAKHAGHKITVRSEYGYDFDDCAEHADCPCCHRRFTCRLPAGHDGRHAPVGDGQI